MIVVSLEWTAQSSSTAADGSKNLSKEYCAEDELMWFFRHFFMDGFVVFVPSPFHPLFVIRHFLFGGPPWPSLSSSQSPLTR
jgi:hypothetical protein